MVIQSHSGTPLSSEEEWMPHALKDKYYLESKKPILSNYIYMKDYKRQSSL